MHVVCTNIEFLKIKGTLSFSYREMLNFKYNLMFVMTEMCAQDESRNIHSDTEKKKMEATNLMFGLLYEY